MKRGHLMEPYNNGRVTKIAAYSVSVYIPVVVSHVAVLSLYFSGVSCWLAGGQRLFLCNRGNSWHPKHNSVATPSLQPGLDDPASLRGAQAWLRGPWGSGVLASPRPAGMWTL